MQAAEQFVSFVKQADAVSITNASISYSENEYEGVKIAIQNLQSDMQNVLGNAPVLQEGIGKKSTILIGTIGMNKDIDALKLADLKVNIVQVQQLVLQFLLQYLVQPLLFM